MKASIRVNGKAEALLATTVAEFLSARGIESARGLAIAVNGAVIPAGTWRDKRLAAGDEIEIVKPFGGG